MPGIVRSTIQMGGRAIRRRIQRFNRLSLARKTWLASLLGLLVAAVSMIFTATGPVPDWFSGRNDGTVGGGDLQVSAFSAERLEDIDADVFDAGTPAGSDKLKSSVIDVVLKNRGDETVVVSAFDFVFKRSEQLPLCEPGGDAISIAGHYDVKVPANPPKPAPFTLRRELRHEIAPGAVERLVFSVGVGEISIYEPVWLFQIQLSAVTDSTSRSLTVGTALVAAPIPNEGFFIGQDQLADADCPKKILDQFERFLGLPGVRSLAFPGIHEELRAYATAMASAPAERRGG